MVSPSALARCVVAALLALALAGCGGGTSAVAPILTAKKDGSNGRAETPSGRQMIGKPYKVGGRWYHPKEDPSYSKVGMASWYGPKFHGKSTANGERFNQNALTAAHPTLPLPSYVRVTRVTTGKSIVVRVNDRGPFARGRIIDLSKAAAQKLGFRSAGQAKVRVTYLGPAEVGGGDRETLRAEAKYGTGGGTASKVASVLTFGLVGGENKSRNDRPVTVAVASNEPVRQTREETSAALPGVRVPVSSRARAPDSNVASATSAYQDPSAGSGGNGGAVDALIALSEPAVPPETALKSEPKRVVVEPLPEVAPEESQARVLGAFDMFEAPGATPTAASGTAAPPN